MTIKTYPSDIVGGGAEKELATHLSDFFCRQLFRSSGTRVKLDNYIAMFVFSRQQRSMTARCLCKYTSECMCFLPAVVSMC